MSRESLLQAIRNANEKRGNAFQRRALGAKDCIEDKHAVAAVAFWPDKTAENWAAAAGVQPRMAKYWLNGSHPVSDSGKLAIRRALDQ